MALNCAMLNQTREPVPLPEEMFITTIDSGAEVILNIPESQTEGGDAGGGQKMKAMGRIWVTDKRFLFTSAPDSSFDSLTVPLPSIMSTRFEQPTFSSNYLYFEIKPSPGGGLTDGTNVQVRFKNRAMFEFVALLEKTRERAIYMRRQAAQADDEDNLPTYTLPEESRAVTLVNGVPVENPPEYGSP
ncbi:ww domain binding protein [Moniliophthora roreri MCA 2997]|uniref:Ww domain binding protein n=1 Tax=Moniliophthora roreri (strain MCA 2997) TaxID=1381753 RepID=V2XNH3_MONRO|nr:ww domain binding protein [Moniliophthora roreri MCA 2997]